MPVRGKHLDPGVAALLAAYLAHLDKALPGRLEGLVLFGSLALDDYRPGQSDVDFLALASVPWVGADLCVLAACRGNGDVVASAPWVVAGTGARPLGGRRLRRCGARVQRGGERLPRYPRLAATGEPPRGCERRHTARTRRA